MSGAYQQYGGNPYGQAEAGEAGYGQSIPNPYTGTGTAPAGGYGTSNPYGGTNDLQPQAAPRLQHGASEYSQASQYSHEPPAAPLTHGPTPYSQQDFLARRDGVNGRITQLSSMIQEVATIHQRLLSSPDNRASAQLEGIIAETQRRNSEIKDEIKFLEREASRDPANSLKRTQVELLKRTFKSQLDDFYKEESDYSKRYREAIARQYKIINPEATEAEVQEAANADWRDDGIFQQALKGSRSGQANSVLGAVRARHNDIQRIEKTMVELSQLFQQLNEQVVYQEPQVVQAEQQTTQVLEDNKKANQQLDEGVKSARRARKLKWYTLLVVVAIIIILGLILGLYFGLRKDNKDKPQ